MNKEWVVDIVQRLPQGTISRGWGWLARRRHPRLGVEILKRGFVAAVGIDMNESAEAVGSYKTLEDLFVRTLKTGARRIDPGPDTLVSPVDGKVGACGVVKDGTLLQVKGRSYSLARLLDDEVSARRYEGGMYATIYLSPRDYHRIHSPLSGKISEARLIPGSLFPVFPEALQKIDELFARNERIITYIDNKKAGRVAVIKVGATMVGRIKVEYDPSLITNKSGQPTRTMTYKEPHETLKGAHLAAFELGSTVVLLVEKGRAELDLTEGVSVQMGQRIGRIKQRRAKK
ncbi:phosphatidylserine decarboxylase [Myxococcota bacterium]|nr:phosphatidylserine decarboxylase [Myxococcota bacterium]